MKKEQDAYGRLLLAQLEGRNAREIIERNDGYIEAGAGPAAYFAPFRRWPAHQRQAMRLVRGRVLDVGAGAGRVALHLQERGHEVVAIDISPLAVEVCRRRGVRDARVVRFEDVDERLGRVDTIVMFGNNFGLFGSAAKATRMLRRLHRLTGEDARIVAESRDVYATDDPDHLAYQKRNRSRGRMSGQTADSRPSPTLRDALVRLPDRVARGDGAARGGNWLAGGEANRRRVRRVLGSH